MVKMTIDSKRLIVNCLKQTRPTIPTTAMMTIVMKLMMVMTVSYLTYSIPMMGLMTIATIHSTANYWTQRKPKMDSMMTVKIPTTDSIRSMAMTVTKLTKG